MGLRLGKVMPRASRECKGPFTLDRKHGSFSRSVNGPWKNKNFVCEFAAERKLFYKAVFLNDE